MITALDMTSLQMYGSVHVLSVADFVQSSDDGSDEEAAQGQLSITAEDMQYLRRSGIEISSAVFAGLPRVQSAVEPVDPVEAAADQAAQADVEFYDPELDDKDQEWLSSQVGIRTCG